MVGVSELAQSVAKRLKQSVITEGNQPSVTPQTSEAPKGRGRTIITERDLANVDQTQPFVIPVDALVTDLAREAAQRRGIEIKRR
jgi:hypothetical protein